MNLEGYELEKFTPMMRQYLEIKKEFSEHSIVLIKASRGMGLERLTKFLCGAES